jgi:hypothetical protein
MKTRMCNRIHCDPSTKLLASDSTTNTYLFHDRCALIVEISDSDLQDYISFQFSHFKASRSDFGGGDVASVHLLSTSSVNVSPDVVCETKNYALKLIFPEHNKAILVVSGKLPKMVLNRYLILALRIVLADAKLFVCHAAAIGNASGSDLFFGKGGAGKTGFVIDAMSQRHTSYIHADDLCFFTEDHFVLGFPRYFSVKLNNYKFFRKHLTPQQNARFWIWKNPVISKLLYKLPFRFGQPPVVHVANFTYPVDMVPAASIIKSFRVLGKPPSQPLDDFLFKVNYDEFSRGFLEKKHMARSVISISQNFRCRLNDLLLLEEIFWKSFTSSQTIRFVVDYYE